VNFTQALLHAALGEMSFNNQQGWKPFKGKPPVSNNFFKPVRVAPPSRKTGRSSSPVNILENRF